MAKFKFKFQSILNIKASLEEQQKLAFAAARKHLDDEEERLNELYKRKAGYEEEGRMMRNNALVVRDICDNETAIVRIMEYIDEQTRAVKKAEDDLEEERLKLVDAMRERKTYEKLRERAFDEFVRDLNHTESLENDEHNSYVYGTAGNGE